MPMFEVLPGLPGVGPVPEQFSRKGASTFREGVVVRFFPVNGETWIGNFQSGWVQYDSAVAHPNGREVLVVAGGYGYLVDPERRTCEEPNTRGITHVVPISECDLVLLVSCSTIEAVGARGSVWIAGIAADGIRIEAIEGSVLTGTRWDYELRSKPFLLNLKTGKEIGKFERFVNGLKGKKLQ